MEEPILVKKEKLTDKLMKKQNKVLIIAVFCILTVVIGSSYALLTNFDQTEEVVTISTGNLTMTINNVLVELNNKLPESDANGLTNASPVTVTMTNTGTMNIMKYEVKLLNDSTQTSTLPYNYIKYAISEDGTNYGTPKNLGTENNIIYTGYNLAVEASKTIYLKAWVDESAGNAALNKTFYGSVTAVLYQKSNLPFSEKLPKNASYVSSYADIIRRNPSFTTQDSHLDNYTKQTVYYYTGEGGLRNGNVLFGGFCWQIIRTTDTGGVKLLYNGVAQNGYDYTSTTILENSDLTNVTNDATYAYTYDATTKKWTSTNKANSSTGTFIFSVTDSAEYMIGYEVSTQYDNDIAYFYKNDVELLHDSGTNTGTIYLGNLTSSDVLKVVYTKNASTNTGNDNVVFSIAKVNSKTDKLMCRMDRTTTLGINATGNGTTQTMTAASVYARHFTYDLNAGTFTLEDTITGKTWASNYSELIGTYTCLSDATTCSTLYYVGTRNESNTSQAYVAAYSIGQVASFTQIGTSPFNANYHSPAMVGYMFNQSYDYKYGNSSTYASTVTWDPNNNIYVLGNDTSSTFDATHHYACHTTCSQLRYYYYQNDSTNYYILLEGGKTDVNALKEMINYDVSGNLTDTNINTYNSAMKGYLENWYRKNLSSYSSLIDQSTVYCNDRSLRDDSKLGGWKSNGTAITGSSAELQFRQNSYDQDLSCTNETDRFSAIATNTKAKLEYPIGLLTEPERYLMTAVKTGQNWWVSSPVYFAYYRADVRNVSTAGGSSSAYVYYAYGARVVVSLSPDVILSSGTGTYENPYVVKTN